MTYQANPIVGFTQKQINNFYSHIKFNKETECWDWQADKDKDGYGMFGLKFGRRAHRISLLIHGIKLIDGLQVDHLCKNKSCVNPEHLEQVTNLENIKRADYQVTMHNAGKTHCKRRHPLSGYNLIIKKGNKRNCRICRNLMENIRRRNNRIKNLALDLLVVEVM